MRVIYIDPGLRDNLGHHANSCRAIRGELLRRGVSVAVCGFSGVSQELRDELHVIPAFRSFTYWAHDNDPWAGWLNTFDSASRLTVEDLGRLQGIVADDLVYFNSAQPIQLMAAIRWFQSLPAERRPHVVVEFGTDPGVDVVPGATPAQIVVNPRDYRVEPRPMFYRFAANQLTEADLTRFHMVTFDRLSSQIFAYVLGKPVGVLPLPQFTRDNLTSRAGRRPITVAVLGHQRKDKGYQLMPLIARLLLAHEPDIRLLIHNGAPNEMPQVQQELRAHAAVETRIVLDEETAGAEKWNSLLAASDLILCPYDPARFLASYSAVATEAVANAIPLVVPAGTSMEALLARFGNPGTIFSAWTPESIVAGVRAALADFDSVAERALAASGQWNATMGVGNMVTSLLAYCQA